MMLQIFSSALEPYFRQLENTNLAQSFLYSILKTNNGIQKIDIQLLSCHKDGAPKPHSTPLAAPGLHGHGWAPPKTPLKFQLRDKSQYV